jgi:CheY-like chemotaxis protein
LKKSNQEKATLIAMLSHELGAPLTSILGYCELLLDEDKNNHNLKVIHRNSIYLQHLIENTLLFGKTEVDSMSTHIEAVNVAEFLGSLVDTILPTAIEKDIFISIQSSEECIINIDVTRTKQILINLLNNAVKYSDQGSVKISCFITKGEYEFLISDTGIGIDESQQDNIFNPWERVNKNDGKGSGIGLFISQKLANAIGGRLLLKESKRNVGSVFQLILPVKEVVQGPENNTLSLSTCLHGKTLLVIDDDQDVLDLIEAFLEKTELKIITALSFSDAQTILLKTNIDLVLTDLNVGTTVAPTFLKELRNNKNNVPVVLMSAMTSNKSIEQFIKNGFNKVMLKPFNYNKLLKIIRNNI